MREFNITNQKGFSLIELMVVVAIIGILSAVAVPQFQKFQRKAKQSEAKAMLAAIYTAQKTFAAETGTYYTNLWATGFEPEGTPLYTLGFQIASGANAPGYTVSPYLHNQYIRSDILCGTTFAGGVGKNCMYAAGTAIGFAATATTTATTFEAWARVSAARLGGRTEDRWIMRQTKELVNIINGAL